MLRPFSFIRLLGQVVLVVYFLAAAVLLGMRYWVLPGIDQWRGQIAAEISHTLGVRVQLGAIQASWDGLDPRFELADVTFSTPQGAQLLHLDKIRARLSWRSLFAGEPRFSLVEATGLDLHARRDAEGRLWIMGRSFVPGADATPPSSGMLPGMRWLLAQPSIVLRDATVQWADQARKAPVLALHNVSLQLVNSGNSHAFRLAALSPDQLDTQFDLRGVLSSTSRGDRPGFSLKDLDGRIYVHIAAGDAKSWSPWVDTPQNLMSTHLDLQAWVSITAGRMGHVASTADIRTAVWRDDTGKAASMDSGSAYVAGNWPAFKRVLEPFLGDEEGGAGPAPGAPEGVADTGAQPVPQVPQAEQARQAQAEPGVQFRLSASDLALLARPTFQDPISFRTVALQGTVSRPDHALQVRGGELDVVNPDMDLHLAGQWRQGGHGQAGIADIRGEFKRVSVAAIPRYLPADMNEDALTWMSNGLLAGVIRSASVLLRGDLDYFPFGYDPDKGQFHIQGRFDNVVIDYAPPEATGEPLGWPRLEDISGRAALDRIDLRIVADTAVIRPVEGQAIHLRDVRARIPDLQGVSILSIQGDTTASATAYLALMRHSPLGTLLDHTLDDAKGTGTWQVPLQMVVPLRHVADASVRGQVRFQDADITLADWMPPQSHVTGHVDFSQDGVDAVDAKAQVLGGPVTIRGAMKKTGGTLKLSGVAQARALDQYAGLAGMSRVTGHVPYRATVGRLASGRYEFALDSTLSGLALNFPPPFEKAASQTLPLHVNWAPTHGAMLLSATMGKASLLLEHGLKAGKGPFFSRGFIGVDRKPHLPDNGLDISVSTPSINMDDWHDVYVDFADSSKGPSGWQSDIFPALHRFSIESPRIEAVGATLDKATFTAQPAKPVKGAGTWRIDLSSSQTAGTAFWHRAHGKKPGRITARFERLALGNGSDKGASPAQEDKNTWKPDGKLRIPAISLHVDRFSVYGHPLGSLSVEGVGKAGGELWDLKKLQLGDGSFHLSGDGQWRLGGADRGLTLTAKVKVSNLGKYLDEMGFKQMMRDGKGEISGHLTWKDLPWSYRTQGLDGEFDVDLKSGSFSYQDSRTARLLKLLSLQSVSRLAKLEWNPANVIKNGFPYDSVHGKVALDAGVLKTDNYRVVGPVGTIALGGTADLNTEKLDLQAVVIPNLDVSGAAVAAGIVINPVVGIGAFLAQWLLRKPLAKSLAVEYGITGNWDDPVIKEVPVKAGSGAVADKAGGAGHDKKKLPVPQH